MNPASSLRSALAASLLASASFPSPARAQELIVGKDGDVDLGGLGNSVCSHGDADGDGVPDFAAGAPNANYDYYDGSAHHHREGTGEVDFFSGATATLRFRVTSAVTGDDFGKTIAALGDVSGDGIGDVLIAAPGASLFRPGSVVVASGFDGSILATLNGAVDFGWSLAALGDVDGDGVPDYAVGSPGSAAYVYSGATATLIHSLTGDANSRSFGHALARLPDVDGDGIDDLIVGDPNDGAVGIEAGAIWVFSGASGSQLLHATPGAKGESSGASVLASPDLDGDGLADVMVGSPLPTFVGTGRVDVLSSATGGVLATFLGANGDEIGLALSRLDDLNGDGVPELSVGGYEPTRPRQLRDGATYELLQWFKSNVGAREALEPAGDVDGDGRPDLLCGIPGSTANGLLGCGRVEVLAADDLWLYSDKRLLFDRDSTALRVREGGPSQPVALFLTGVDGVPFFTLVLFSTLDAAGSYDSSTFTLPPFGFGAHEFELRAFALEAGRVVASREERIDTI